jgi:hypothetical protein
MNRAATYGHNGALRWTLTREWAPAGPTVCFIGHNPSTAGHELEDPTTLAWIHFARLWGYSGYTAVNLYPYRSPDPKTARAWALSNADATHQNCAIVVAEAKRAALVVACYGAIAVDQVWNEHVLAQIRLGAAPYPAIHIFGLTAGGAPKHAMARGHHRIPRDQQPILWKAAA